MIIHTNIEMFHSGDTRLNFRKLSLMSPQQAFSFLEVMAAMMILSMGLIVLLGNQSQSIKLITKADQLDQAVYLATLKMSEITQIAKLKGIKAVPDDQNGTFEETQSQSQDFSWHVYKTSVALPDFSKMMPTGSSETANNAQMAGPMEMVMKTWQEAIFEVHVDVSWMDGKRKKSYELITHFIEPTSTNAISSLLQSLSGGQGDGAKAPE